MTMPPATAPRSTSESGTTDERTTDPASVGLRFRSEPRHFSPPVIEECDQSWRVVAADGLTVELSVSVVIPARNEALNLPYVLLQIPPGVAEVLLVDGNSTDGTAEVARALRPEVRVIGQPGKGKGDALRAGFAAATGDIIVMLDADGSMSPLEIGRYIDALASGCDVVTGSRFMEGGSSADITPLRSAGNLFLNVAYAKLYGGDATDLCYGYMAFWRHCLPALGLDADGFEIETLVNVRAALAGLTVAEVPSHEARRLHGESNLRTFRDGFRVLRTLVSERVSWSLSADRRRAVGAAAPR